MRRDYDDLIQGLGGPGHNVEGIQEQHRAGGR